nr:MAG TPA: hypothetical protein [Caudoviricetes sp.]
MSRWTIEQLKKIDDLEFAVSILNERRNELTNIYSPLSEKLARAARVLEGLAALKRTQAIVIELPEGMTEQEREDLADAMHDYRIEASEEDRTVGIYAMPGRELEILSKLEEALRT